MNNEDCADLEFEGYNFPCCIMFDKKKKKHKLRSYIISSGKKLFIMKIQKDRQIE